MVWRTWNLLLYTYSKGTEHVTIKFDSFRAFLSWLKLTFYQLFLDLCTYLTFLNISTNKNTLLIRHISYPSMVNNFLCHIFEFHLRTKMRLVVTLSGTNIPYKHTTCIPRWNGRDAYLMHPLQIDFSLP